MVNCPKCGAQMPDHSRFCGIDGTKLPDASKLHWFEIQRLKDLFGDLLLYKDIIEVLRIKDANPSEVYSRLQKENNSQIQAGSLDSELGMFLESCYIQALAETYPDRWGKLNIDKLKIDFENLYPTVRKRAQELTNIGRDPREAWNQYFVETEFLKRHGFPTRAHRML